MINVASHHFQGVQMKRKTTMQQAADFDCRLEFRPIVGAVQPVQLLRIGGVSNKKENTEE